MTMTPIKVYYDIMNLLDQRCAKGIARIPPGIENFEIPPGKAGTTPRRFAKCDGKFLG